MPTSMITAMAPRRGTEVSDCSCRLVRVCTRLRRKLSSAAAISSGAARMMASFISWRSISATISGVIAFLSKTLQQRTGEQIPAIYHDKKQNLQRRKNHHRRQLEHEIG